MKIENSKVILYALTLNQLKEFQREIFKFQNIDFEDFELSLNQKKAIGIKIDKMNQCEADIHSWYTYWLIVDNKSLKAVGTIGFKGLNDDDSTEVGYEISEKHFGKGYMSTSLTLLVEWVRSQIACNRLTAIRVLKKNYGSQRVLEKNGFMQINSDENFYDYEMLLTN